MRCALASLARFGVVAALALAGCQAPPGDPSFAPLVFAGRGALTLDVGAIEIVSAYRPPLAAPNVEHLFPQSPEAAARRWAEERLRPAGTGARATFTVTEASVVETRLPRRTGLQGIVTDDQSERYDASLKVELSIHTGVAEVAKVHAEATASRSVPESISVNGRRQVWWEMTAALMDQLDRTLEAEIRGKLARHLR